MSSNRCKRKYNFFHILIRTIGIFIKVNPRHFMLFLFANIVAGLIQPSLLFVQQNIFDNALKYSNNMVGISYIITFVVIYIVLRILIHYIDSLDDILQSYAYIGCEAAMTKNMNNNVAYLKLDNFEDEELFKQILKSKNAIGTTARTQFHIMSGIIYQAITLTGYLGYLLAVKPTLLLMAVLMCVPISLSFFIKGKYYHELQNANASFIRRTRYFASCMNGKEYFKETRTLGVLQYFYNLLKDSIEELNNNERKTSKKIFIINLFLALASFLSIGGVFFLAAYYLFIGEIAVGAFASVLVAIDDLYFYIYGTFYIIGNAIKNAPQSRFYFEFIDNIKGPEGIVKDIEIRDKIELKNISYSYPSSDKLVISGVSLNLKKGEKIAIVGKNGAGKTTLVKLICGLYLSNSGKVLYDDIDIKTVNESCLYTRFSAVFQDFGKYMLTLRQNIALSDYKNIDNNNKMEHAIRNSNFNLDYAGKILDTTIGREYGGIELSGGEWQRVAIARGFFREHDVIVLDEPTSAIDPIIENEMYEKFVEIIKDKTAIIVTHRLGSAKIADRIIVMDSGKIVEEGTHEQLIYENGLYAEMYKSQSDWYQR